MTSAHFLWAHDLVLVEGFGYIASQTGTIRLVGIDLATGLVVPAAESIPSNPRSHFGMPPRNLDTKRCQ